MENSYSEMEFKRYRKNPTKDIAPVYICNEALYKKSPKYRSKYNFE